MDNPSQRMESILDAIIVLTVCIVGLISNLVATIVLTHSRVFRNPFGMLTTIHTIANVGVLSIFAFWSVPLMTIYPTAQISKLNYKLGQLSLFFVEVAFHACFFISLNRLTAIYSPSFYRNRFTVKLTFFLIFFIMIISLSYWAIYFFPDCDFYFDAEGHIWTFSDTPCGRFLSKYCDMTYNVILFTLTGLLDLITLFLLRGASKKLGASTDTIRRRKKEIRFFAQAFLNTIIYAFMLVCFHIISYKVTSNFSVFLCTTGIWGLSHACGGLILVAFNKEIRRVFSSPKHFVSYMFDSKSQSQVTIVTRKSDAVSTF